MHDVTTSVPIFAGTTDEGHLTLAGTTAANAVVEIYDSFENLVGSTQSDTNGNWSFTAEQVVSQGENTLSVVVNGQVSQAVSINSLSSVAPALDSDVSAVDVISDKSDLPLQVELNTPDGSDSPASLPGVTPTAVLATHTIDSAYDDAGGETGFVGNGGTTDDTRPSFRGQSSETGTFINIYANGNFLGSAYVGLRGEWQLQVPAERALEPGEHVLTVVDAAGNTSEPFTLTIEIPESSRPVIEAVFDDTGEAGEIVNGGTTDDRTPTFSGHGEAGAQVFLYSGGAIVGSAFVQPDGSYTLSTNLPLAPGEHSLTVVANRIASHPFTLTVADTEPVIKPVIDSAFDDFGKIGDIANGGTTDDTTPTLRGQGEAFTQVVIYNGSVRIGSTFSGPDGTWSFNVPTLNQGEHVLTAVSTTIAGIPISSDPFTLTVSAPDSAKPVIDSAFDDFGKIGDIANGGTTDDTTPTLRGQGEAFTQVVIYNGSVRIGSTFSGPDGSWSFNVPTLNQGEHVLTVVNAGVSSDPFTLTVSAPDSAKPVIDSAFDDFGKFGDITNGGTTDDTTPTLRGQGEAFTQVVIYNGSVRIGSTFSGPDGTWSFNVPTLNQGEHVLTVVNAGVSSDPFTLTVSAPDSAKPVIDSAFDDFGEIGEITNGGTTDDTTPTLRGQGEAFTQVVIYNGSVRIGSTFSGPDGSWSFNVPTLNQGEHVLTVVNAGVSSDPFTLNVSAPNSTKPVIDSVFDNIGTVGELVSGNTTDDARPTFNGRGEPFTLLTVYDNGMQVAKIPVDQNGSWSFTDHYNKLSPGEHLFTFVGAGVASEPFVLHVENAPETPKPTINSAFDSVGTEVGNVTSGALIDDPRPVFSGHGEPDSTIFIYDHYGYAGATLVDEHGNWTFQPSEFGALNPGEHVFTAVADGVRSEPFVLRVEPAALAIEVATNEGASDLPLLFDLLQPTSELFAGETDLSPLDEVVADLSSFGLDDELNAGLPQFDTTDGIPVVFSTVAPLDFWQQSTEYPVG